jgi:hypothetical protein
MNMAPPTSRKFDRRELLRSTAGALAVPLVAGCTDRAGDGSATPETTAEPSPVTSSTGTPSPSSDRELTVQREDVSLSVSDHGIANPGISLWNCSTHDGVTYTANRWGNPVKAAGFDHESRTVTDTYSLPSGSGCLAVEAMERYVFFVTTTDGGVHRLERSSGTVEQIATFDVGNVYTWNLESAPDGTLYAATSNNSRVYEIDPESGEYTVIGPLAETEEDAYDLVATDDAVYVGVGNTENNGLYHVDRSDHEVTRLVPDSVSDFVQKVEYTSRYLICHVIYDKSLIVDLDSGSPGSLDAATVVNPLPGTYATSEAAESTVYYPAFPSQIENWSEIEGFSGDVHDPDQPAMYSYDIETGERRKEFEVSSALSPDENDLNYRSTHITDGTYVGVQKPSAASLAVYDLESGDGGTYDLQAIGMDPTAIVNQSVGEFRGQPVTNRHGMMYVHDVEAGTRTGVPVSGEVKRLVEVEETLYLGIYPGAEFHTYDGESVRELATADGQVRPLDLIYNEATDSVVMGTQPNYGAKTGGSIAVLDRGTEELTTYENVIPDQSVTSLATAGEVVYGGGSTVRGGGTQPATEEARLAAFDLTSGETTWDLVPVPDADAIADVVTNGERIVGIAGTTLFSVDVESQTVEDTTELGFRQRHEQGSDGAYYGVVGGGETGGVIRMNLEDLDVTHLRGDVFSHLHESEIVDDSVFFVDPETWRLTEVSDVTAYGKTDG